ncbi:MAG: Holliday junction branch migration protein RuvA [Holosporales bacterium]
MITFVKGHLAAVEEGAAVIDVGGVGMHILCSAYTLGRLPGLGEACLLHTEMVVREDFIHLYGFADTAERSAFRTVLSVQGVGMKVALALLSIGAPETLMQAIASGDKTYLARADGVGPKLAARIAHELKDKVSGMAMPVSTSSQVQGAVSPAARGVQVSSAHQDVLSALQHLGYRAFEAEQALSKALQNDPENDNVETLIKNCLGHLSRA